MIARAIATFFGVGYVPVAPGTVASLIALPLAWLIQSQLGSGALLALSFVVYALGVWACGEHAAKAGVIDPSECVID